MEDVPVVDPHFHIWDVTQHDTTGHSAEYLAGPGTNIPVYLCDDYLSDMSTLPRNLKFKAGVFVEALSDYPVKEARWVAENMQRCPAIVGYAYLPDHQVEQTLKELASCPKVVGIRQIVNHHPTDASLIWPKVHCPNYLKDAAFRRGYSLLQKYNFSFDLHANPHQLKDAAALFHDFPETPVVINHLGCLKLSDDSKENDERLKVWREGMQALAALPYTSVKLSCLSFTKKAWEIAPDSEDANNSYNQVKNLVLETINLFGSDRCMFATNFPVDKHNGVSARDMYQTFSDWTKHLPYQDRKNLFHDTAARAYRLEYSP